MLLYIYDKGGGNIEEYLKEIIQNKTYYVPRPIII